jgi:hypothetical protein
MPDRARGHYLGTEIEEKWWRRYAGESFLARGMGEYWLDEAALNFKRHLIKTPLRIPFTAMRDIKTGTFHAGRWNLGRPILKVIWEHEGQRLSSGFIVSTDEARVKVVVEALTQKISPRGDGTDPKRVP